MHAAHWRSVVLEPCTDRPLPSGHVDHAVQLSITRLLALDTALYVPVLQLVHVRSMLADATVVV